MPTGSSCRLRSTVEKLLGLFENNLEEAGTVCLQPLQKFAAERQARMQKVSIFRKKATNKDRKSKKMTGEDSCVTNEAESRGVYKGPLLSTKIGSSECQANRAPGQADLPVPQCKPACCCPPGDGFGVCALCVPGCSATGYSSIFAGGSSSCRLGDFSA